MPAVMSDTSETVAGLRAILTPYASQMIVTADGPNGFSLDTRHILPNKQPLFFGSVKVQKNYVSFYLMPVYVFPEILSGISENLRKRMQGKSCFNFRQVDPDLFNELAALTRAGFERYQAAGYINPAAKQPWAGGTPMELSELAFFTDDVVGMTEFYQKLLGKAPDYAGQNMTLFTLGAITFLIHARYSPADNDLPPDNHFAFKVEDVDAACARLVQQGLSLEHPPHNYDWGRSAYLRDPDGQLIELAQG